jgi:hypothetical protein
MKHIAILLLMFSIVGCANKHTPIQPEGPTLPSIEFLLEGDQTLKISYAGMPKEIAEKFMAAVYEQRNRFSEYWNIVENPENSLSVWHSCNKNSCNYGFSIFVPCDGGKIVHFSSEGIYPDIRFSYINHGQGVTECCFVGVKLKQPWWKRIFN